MYTWSPASWKSGQPSTTRLCHTLDNHPDNHPLAGQKHIKLPALTSVGIPGNDYYWIDGEGSIKHNDPLDCFTVWLFNNTTMLCHILIEVAEGISALTTILVWCSILILDYSLVWFNKLHSLWFQRICLRLKEQDRPPAYRKLQWAVPVHRRHRSPGRLRAAACADLLKHLPLVVRNFLTPLLSGNEFRRKNINVVTADATHNSLCVQSRTIKFVQKMQTNSVMLLLLLEAIDCDLQGQI